MRRGNVLLMGKKLCRRRGTFMGAGLRRILRGGSKVGLGLWAGEEGVMLLGWVGFTVRHSVDVASLNMTEKTHTFHMHHNAMPTLLLMVYKGVVFHNLA